MHDRLDHHGMNEEASLAAALRALPASAPPRDTWPALSARVRRRRAVRKTVWFTLPAAFAACIALVMLWPLAPPRAPLTAPARVAQRPQPAPSSAPAAPNIGALQASSRQWQTWVQNLDDNGAPLNGGALAQAVALQDRIGMVDLQLSAARDPATLAGLWQQRIVLLQRLGLLHLQPYAVAEHTLATSDQTTIL
jgi:hypothetical protein